MSLYTWSLTVGEENNNESDVEKTVKSSLIEFSSDTAKFLAQVFGETITDGVGIIGDKIKYNRYIRAADLHQKASKNLKRKGIKPETYRPIAAKIGIPLLENASLEEDDELHTLWSKLLANALDPNFSGDISFMHVSLLKEMMPLDVKILLIIFNTKNQKFSTTKLDEVSFSKAEIAQSLYTNTHKIEISLLNLMRLGCIKGGNVKTEGIKFGGMPNTVYLGTEEIHLSALGFELCTAAIAN